MSQCNCFVWPTRGPGGVVGCCHTMELFRFVLSYNGIVWFGVVVQWNGLVWCCRTMEWFGLMVTTCIIFVVLEPTQLFYSPRAHTTFFSCPEGPPPPGPRRGCRGGDEDTLFLAVSSCHNIMFLHVVTQWNCFGLVLSYNWIVWFGVVVQWNGLV